MSQQRIRRERGRIYFGEGDAQWSVTDPEGPHPNVHDYLYLVLQCPTTTLAQKKLAEIRRAVREVPSPWK